MPEINQYVFKYHEVLEALVKKAGLHEGRWQLIATFGLGAANIGIAPTEVVPGAVVTINTLGLQRAAPESPEGLTIDAAAVNPSASEKQRPSSRSRRAAS